MELNGIISDSLVSGTIRNGARLNGTVLVANTGATQNDHSVALNRDLPNQHPMSAITGLPEVFWATYNETSYADIRAAYDAGKTVLLHHPDNIILPLKQFGYDDWMQADYAEFYGVVGLASPYVYEARCDASQNFWTRTRSLLATSGTTGALSNLDTTAKNNLVAAINEVNAHSGGTQLVHFPVAIDLDAGTVTPGTGTTYMDIVGVLNDGNQPVLDATIDSAVYQLALVKNSFTIVFAMVAEGIPFSVEVGRTQPFGNTEAHDTWTLHIYNNVGDLSDLTTTAKNNLVAAINEVNAKASGDGLTDAAKQALLQLARKVAYVDENGEEYYQDLYEALYNEQTYTVTNNLTDVTNNNISTRVVQGGSYLATLTATSGYTINSVTITMGGVNVTGTAYSSGTISIANVTGNIVITAVATQRQATLLSITATFSQGSAVIFDDASLDSLKQYLAVTANYDDSSSETLADSAYTLSGTLTAGTSTITASYGGKSDTFNVTVTSTAIIDQNVTMNSSTQTLLDQEVVYDSTALYSWQYTFGTHTPVSTATTPNRVYGPMQSNGASRDGALQYNGSASEWRYVWKSSGIAFTPADGDVLTYVHNFATDGTSIYLNGTQLRSESIGQSYYNPVGKVAIQPDNAQMTVGITHIKIAKGDLH